MIKILNRRVFTVIGVLCLMVLSWNTGRMSPLRSAIDNVNENHRGDGGRPNQQEVATDANVNGNNQNEELNVRKLLGSIVQTSPPHNPRTPWVETISWKPRIVVYHNFITPSEGQEIIGLAGGEVSRSLVTVKKDAEKDSAVSTARTSSGVFIHEEHMMRSPLLRDMERRLAEFTHVPVEHGEAFYLLQYLPGQEYKGHTDWFDELDDGQDSGMDEEGNRIITAIVYLQKPESGGDTLFTRLNITVPCVSGDAVIFWNFDPAGQPDILTEHAGLPVEKGVKWALTKWMRQRKEAYNWYNRVSDEDREGLAEEDEAYMLKKYGKNVLTKQA